MHESIAPDDKKLSLNLSLDYRVIIGLLIALIIIMLGLWRPWEAHISANARTIDVTGKATLSAVPDEFVFYPTYSFTNTDEKAALKDLSTKSDELVSKLRALGVPNNKIKTNSDSYGYPPYYPDKNADDKTYTLRLTVTVNDSKLVQKVQDYLVSTTPSGSVSPQANFSQAKQKDLETQARSVASKDAREKAEQSAKNLGFRLGKVKSVQDGTGFNRMYYPMGINDSAKSSAPEPSLTVQPGENELNYTVSVSYYLK